MTDHPEEPPAPVTGDLKASGHSGVIRRTEEYVREELFHESSGHDWSHVARVVNLALAISAREGGEIDLHVVTLAALLHDISDYKLNGGDIAKGPRVAFDWLVNIGESREVAAHVADIIDTMSFKGAGVRTAMNSIEGKIVQDADRLDALGAIGVARAFTYAGHKGERMHDAAVSPRWHCSQAEYMQGASTTINHFYEKLLLLKDRMNTATGRELAERRHKVLEEFLANFLLEWDAQDLEPVT